MTVPPPVMAVHRLRPRVQAERAVEPRGGGPGLRRRSQSSSGFACARIGGQPDEPADRGESVPGEGDAPSRTGSRATAAGSRLPRRPLVATEAGDDRRTTDLPPRALGQATRRWIGWGPTSRKASIAFRRPGPRSRPRRGRCRGDCGPSRRRPGCVRPPRRPDRRRSRWRTGSTRRVDSGRRAPGLHLRGGAGPSGGGARRSRLRGAARESSLTAWSERTSSPSGPGSPERVVIAGPLKAAAMTPGRRPGRRSPPPRPRRRRCRRHARLAPAEQRSASAGRGSRRSRSALVEPQYRPRGVGRERPRPGCGRRPPPPRRPTTDRERAASATWSARIDASGANSGSVEPRGPPLRRRRARLEERLQPPVGDGPAIALL